MQKEDLNCCPQCNAKLSGRWENICKGQVNTLAKFRQAVIDKNENSVHLNKDIKLSHSEYTNFQKLRYNGLVAHSNEAGYWLLTRRGARFLRNEISIPKGVLIFRNKIQDYSTKIIDLKSILKNDEPYWFKKEDYEWEAIERFDFVLEKYDWIKFDKKGQGILNFG